ncbi:MAG: N-acetyltransferase, partial [Flavobacteriales bacterium]
MLTIDLPTFPMITTERLVLRELLASDAAAVLAMRSDPEVMRHVNRPLAQSLDDASAVIELINTRGAAGESV